MDKATIILTPIVRRILSGVRPTQYDMMPQHPVNIMELFCEMFLK